MASVQHKNEHPTACCGHTCRPSGLPTKRERVAPRAPQGWRAGSERATTLVEVTLAVVILAIVISGAVSFLVSGRCTVEYAAKQRTAGEIGMERLERARSLGYAALVDDEDTVDVDGTTYTWTLTVSDSLANPSDPGSAYKILEVSTDWPTSKNSPVALRSAVAPWSRSE